MNTHFTLKDVALSNGFMLEKERLNSAVTVHAVYRQFEQTGRFEQLKCLRQEGLPNFSFVWDSDIAKWLEAVAYILHHAPNAELRKKYDEAVDDIVSNQCEDGYFNSYFQVYTPEVIFRDRTNHELYNAGHLFEAAVAASQYLGDDRLLGFSERFCNCIRKHFIEDRDTGFLTPGHEEIELALIKLYLYTKNELYFELADFFLSNRGKQVEGKYPWANQQYAQSHAPVTEQHTAEGHAVRALYLYIAMADMARLKGDEGLARACEDIFEDIVQRKMYITGGVGSTHRAEAFTFAYDLPNSSAYSETCASIAFAFFCDRMIQLSGKAAYGDAFERVLYNGLLSGWSHDGKRFFYENPLEVDEKRFSFAVNGGLTDRLPGMERAEVFVVSCCPPNLNRFIEQIPMFIYYPSACGITVQQYISSSLNTDGMQIQMESGFPYNGRVRLTVSSNGVERVLKLRKPAWCTSPSCSIEYTEQNGYLVIQQVFDQTEILLDFPMQLRAVYPHTEVVACARKIALSYGPLVLCAEGIDNPNKNLKAVIPHTAAYTVEAGEYFKIKTSGWFSSSPSNSLYTYEPPQQALGELVLIPYFEWANRGRSDMQVWFHTK